MAFLPSHLRATHLTRREWFVVHPRGLLARQVDTRWVLPTDDDLAALGADPAHAHALGVLDDAEALAVASTTPVEKLGAFEPLMLRTLAASMPPERFTVAGRAIHVIDWATTSAYCGRCGAKTERSTAERASLCPACGLTAYPRIAPAIIVLVRRGEQALLARNAKFPGVMFSTLAGFSEIGESLEETLVREVEEEVGVRVHQLSYFGSQPWPFPHSLMIAFTAEYESGAIRVDPTEIAEAAWFSPEALPPIPPPLSIARRMIDAWCAEVLAARAAR
jgi:NAD+ diphosphatase